MKAIANRSEYDEPAKGFELPVLADQECASFIDTDDLDAIEEGIRTLDASVSMFRIIQGLAILKAESLWDQSGAASLWEYRRMAAGRYGLSKASVSNLRKIGYAWMDNVKILRRIDLTGKAMHLLFFQEALNRYQDKKLVIEHLKADSAREFQAWAREGLKEIEELVPDVDVSISKDSILLDGDPVLQVSESLSDTEKSFIGKLLKDGYKARRGNCLAHVIAVYDKTEAAAVDKFLKDRRSKR